MDFIINAIVSSITDTNENKQSYNSYESILIIKSINNQIVRERNDENTLRVIKDNFSRVTCMYLWSTRCCEEPSVVAETYNRMNMIGILFFKCVSILLDGRYESIPIEKIFPGMTGIIVSDSNIKSMTYRDVSSTILALQHEWSHLVSGKWNKNAAYGLLLCVCRFGELITFSHSSSVLNESEYREPISADNTKLFMPTTRCIRNIITTVMIMLRSLTIAQNSKNVSMHTLSDETRALVIQKSLQSDTADTHRHVNGNAKKILQLIQNIKFKKEHQTNAKKYDQVQKMWNCLENGLNRDKMGEIPTKISDDLSDILHKITVCIYDLKSSLTDMNFGIIDEYVYVLEAAIKSFYIVPSADKFRQISYIQSILPGQRINYAFDYQFFDSGQLSQIIYMYNPIYKARAPPNTIQDWNPTEFAGPVAAVSYLIPELEVYLEDSEDPLGLLGQDVQILRPADYQKPIENTKGTDKLHWRLIVNSVNVFLINTLTLEIYSVDEKSSKIHGIIILLAFFIKKAGYTTTICEIAINAVKLCS
jgi:hypothetical protein